jgi:hypothetical protein
MAVQAVRKLTVRDVVVPVAPAEVFRTLKSGLPRKVRERQPPLIRWRLRRQILR